MNISVRAEGDKEFNRVLTEYAKWNKRQPMEIATAKAYFISLNAMSTTKTADKGKIAEQLSESSKKFAGVPLAAIIVNRNLGNKNKKGLTGQKMTDAITKYIKKAQSKTQFLRSGWIAAAKTLDFWNKRGDVSFSKRFAPKKPQGVRQIGNPKGFAQVNNQTAMCSVTIGNMIGQGKQQSKTVTGILEEGLIKAVKRETQSMISYITKKYQEKFDKMKRQRTF